MSRQPLYVFALIVAATALPHPASADLVATIQDSTAQQGTVGFFDIIVTSDADVGTPDTIGGYTVTLDEIAGATYTGLVTTDGPSEAVNGYLFPSSSPEVGGFESDLSYFDLGEAPGTNASAGQVYSVGRVFYNAVTPGVYSVSWDQTRSGFLLADLTDIPTTFVNGTLTITPAAVPEPSSALLLSLAGLAGYAVRRRRSARRRVAA